MHAPRGYRPRLTKPKPVRMYVHRRQTQRSATTCTRGIRYRRQHSLVSTSDAAHGPVPVTLATLSKTSSWHRKGLSSSDAMIRPTPSGQRTRHAASKSASSRSVSPAYTTMMAPGLPLVEPRQGTSTPTSNSSMGSAPINSRPAAYGTCSRATHRHLPPLVSPHVWVPRVPTRLIKTSHRAATRPRPAPQGAPSSSMDVASRSSTLAFLAIASAACRRMASIPGVPLRPHRAMRTEGPGHAISPRSHGSPTASPPCPWDWYASLSGGRRRRILVTRTVDAMPDARIGEGKWLRRAVRVGRVLRRVRLQATWCPSTPSLWDAPAPSGTALPCP